MSCCTGIDSSVTDSLIFSGHEDGSVRVWSFR